jgi:hypothetical protein
VHLVLRSGSSKSTVASANSETVNYLHTDRDHRGLASWAGMQQRDLLGCKSLASPQQTQRTLARISKCDRTRHPVHWGTDFFWSLIIAKCSAGSGRHVARGRAEKEIYRIRQFQRTLRCKVLVAGGPMFSSVLLAHRCKLPRTGNMSAIRSYHKATRLVTGEVQKAQLIDCPCGRRPQARVVDRRHYPRATSILFT